MSVIRGSILASLLLTLLVPVASAGPGAIEINHATALAGIDGGDSPGYPVIISAGGSYRLVGNLVVPDANTTAIAVNADGVTIDLNGFSISGSTTCTWSSPNTNCTGTGTGMGIDAQNDQAVQVRNGTIRGMGNDGINLGVAGSVERVFVVDAGNAGIRLGARGQARLNQVLRVNDHGIIGASANVVTDNIINEAAAGIGISGGYGVISGNIIRNATAQGINHVGRYGSIKGNVIHGTSGAISCDDDCILSRNAAVQGRGGGFLVDNEAVILENMIYNNPGVGIAAGLDGIISRNFVDGNASVNLTVDSAFGDRTGVGANYFEASGTTCLTGGAKMDGVIAVSTNVCNGFVGCLCIP